MRKINEAVKYFDEQVGHFTDYQKIAKLREETNELENSFGLTNDDTIDECSDVLTIAFHIASRNGYKGTPNDLFMQAYYKMKRRIEKGERDYKNRDF